MSISKVLIQFEDNDSYTSNVVDLIVQSLQANAERMKTEEITELGKGFESVTRPWALVFLKDDGLFQAEITKRRKIQTEEELPWLNSICVCRIDTSHQLRVILSALHLKEKQVRSHEPKQLNVLNWIENEKDGQPPSLVVVTDLLGLLAEDKRDYNNKMQFMTINHNELSTLLATLVESCVFESTLQSDKWEQNLGVKMKHLTDLIITDKSFLPSLDDEFRDKFETTAVKSLHKILQYYLDHVYVNMTG